MTIDLHHFIHLDPEIMGLLREQNSKLIHISERISHMATDAQVAKLTTDVNALIAAVEAFKTAVLDAIAKAQGQSNDPAIDALDATVADEAAKITAAMPAPAPTPPPAA